MMDDVQTFSCSKFRSNLLQTAHGHVGTTATHGIMTRQNPGVSIKMLFN